MPFVLYLKLTWICIWMYDCKAKVFAGLLVSFLLRWIFEANNFPVSNNFSSISMTSMHLWRRVKKKEGGTTLRTQKKRKLVVGQQLKVKIVICWFCQTWRCWLRWQCKLSWKQTNCNVVTKHQMPWTHHLWEWSNWMISRPTFYSKITFKYCFW